MIDQLGIALTGVVAIFFTQSKRPARQRYACLFGIAGQPFWFWSAWEAGQWGVFALCCLYALAWAKGVWQHWLRPVRAPQDLTAEEEQQLHEAFRARRHMHANSNVPQQEIQR